MKVKFMSLLGCLVMMLGQPCQAFCFREAGRDMKVDPLLLASISYNETRMKSRAIGVNRNSKKQVVSRDYGLMQINSANIARVFLPLGITHNNLLEEPCLNVYAGAYIIRDLFDRYGVNWWAVGAYNAGTRRSDKQEQRRQHYASEIKSIYQAMIAIEKEGKLPF